MFSVQRVPDYMETMEGDNSEYMIQLFYTTENVQLNNISHIAWKNVVNSIYAVNMRKVESLTPSLLYR